MSAQTYEVHGVRLLVSADCQTVAEAVDARLRHFRSAPGSAGHDLAVELARTAGHAPAGQPGGGGRAVYDTPFGPIRYRDASDELWGDCGGQAQLQVRAGQGLAHLVSDRAWLISHPLLTIALVELLKRRSLFALHAGAVACGDAVILFPGPSGSGKTTLALALARHGWGFLADDMVFLRAGEVLGFPDEVDVGDGTVALLPELAPSLRQQAADGRAKRPLFIEEAFGVGPVLSGRPVAVVLPRVAHEDRSRLVPVGPDEALVELAPNVLLTHAAASQAHFDALAGLARSVPCFRLETGRDLDRVAELTAALVA